MQIFNNTERRWLMYRMDLPLKGSQSMKKKIKIEGQIRRGYLVPSPSFSVNGSGWVFVKIAHVSENRFLPHERKPRGRAAHYLGILCVYCASLSFNSIYQDHLRKRTFFVNSIPSIHFWDVNLPQSIACGLCTLPNRRLYPWTHLYMLSFFTPTTS